MQKHKFTVVTRFFSSLLPRRRVASRVVLETQVLDPEKVAAWLRVDELARRAAVEWEAGNAGRSPDADEQLFRGYHEEMLRGIVANVRRAIGDLRALWEVATRKSDPRRLRELLDKAQQLIVRKSVLLREQLVEARREVVHAHRRRRVLLDRHKIDPPAELEHQGTILAVLFFFLTLEALFNAHFFALGEQDGLLGGFTMAFLAALVNVAASFFVGWAMRGISIAGARRIVGSAMAVVCTVSLITFQLALGHYRAALARVAPEQAMATAIETLTTSPLLIPDLTAWLLVLVGLTFSFVAAFAGVAFADPIPGWRGMVKRLKAAEEAYEALKEGFLTGVQQVSDEQIAAVDGLLAEAEDAGTDAVKYEAEMDHCLEAHAASAASTAVSYTIIIKRYRQIFARIAGRPGPFRDEPRLLIPALLEDATLSTVDEMAAERKRRLGLLADAADEVKRALRDRSNAAMATLPALIADVERVVEGPPALEAEPETVQLTLWPTSRNGGDHVYSN